VKIKVRHTECGREVLVHQILESQGHCPWDGKPLSAQYNAVLAEALAAAEIAGGALVHALERATMTGDAIVVEQDSVMAPILAAMESPNPAPDARAVPA
jgi:hypothetical protein